MYHKDLLKIVLKKIAEIRYKYTQQKGSLKYFINPLYIRKTLK